MKYKFDDVLNGISKYINDEIFTGMNDWQEFLARLAVSRIMNNKDSIRDTLANNGFIKTFAIIDNEGMIDVETLAREIKAEISKKGKLKISVPMFGDLTFSPSDVNCLYRTITNLELN